DDECQRRRIADVVESLGDVESESVLHDEGGLRRKFYWKKDDEERALVTLQHSWSLEGRASRPSSGRGRPLLHRSVLSAPVTRYLRPGLTPLLSPNPSIPPARIPGLSGISGTRRS